MVKDKDSEVHAIALRFLAHCFASDEPRYIDLGLANDVLFSFDQLLGSPSTEIVKETLWGLSNITASNETHAAAFLAEEYLYRKVINMMSHSHSQLRAESLWIISNLIAKAGP